MQIRFSIWRGKFYDSLWRVFRYCLPELLIIVVGNDFSIREFLGRLGDNRPGNDIMAKLLCGKLGENMISIQSGHCFNNLYCGYRLLYKKFGGGGMQDMCTLRKRTI